VLMFAGALIRQFFVQRHGYHLGRAKNPWPFAAVGVALIVAVILAMAPWGSPASAPANAQAKPATFAQVKSVIDQRCLSCHGTQVQMKNVRLDSLEGIQLNAQNVYQQVSVTKQMPMNNATGITQEERDTIASWYLAGAKLD
jgi:uncharacterized membrane protein